MWGHCSLLLGPGMHEVLFVPSKSLFTLSCVSSGGSMVGLMVAFSKEGLCNTQVYCTQSPCPCDRPLLIRSSAGDSWTFMGKSESVSCGVTAPFSWVLTCTRSVCAIQESVSQSCVSSGSSVRVRRLPPRGLMPYPSMLHPEALPLRQSAADPYLHRNTQTVLSQSLWGL